MKQFLEEARRLIRTGSPSHQGNEEVANFAHSILQDRGFRSDMQMVFHSLEAVSKRQFNVIGILGDQLVDRKTRKGLLLLSSLDTSTPGLRQNWTESAGDPFELTVRDEHITGLGVASGKLDFLCRLHAAQRFREKKLKMPIYIVGTCGGSLGMFGAKYLIQSKALNPMYTLVSAPTALQLGTVHKGWLQLRVFIGFPMVERDARGFNRRLRILSRGKMASSADPEQGEHAVLHALALLEQAIGEGFDLRFTALEGGEWPSLVPDECRVEFYTSPHQFEDFKLFFETYSKRAERTDSFDLEFGALNETGVRFYPEALFPCMLDIFSAYSEVGHQLSGLDSVQIQPPGTTVHFSSIKPRLGGLELGFDIRPMPGLSQLEVESRFQTVLQVISKKYPSVNLTLTKERFVPSMQAQDSAGAARLAEVCVEAGAAAGLSIHPVELAAASESALFQKAGYEVASFGPGSPFANVGSPNENVSITELEQAMTFYDRLIEQVCL
jgi:acetylornithine deacetylase/succinyl-diaminopimelate desuccinylase-like protein